MTYRIRTKFPKEDIHLQYELEELPGDTEESLRLRISQMSLADVLKMVLTKNSAGYYVLRAHNKKLVEQVVDEPQQRPPAESPPRILGRRPRKEADSAKLPSPHVDEGAGDDRHT